MTTKKKATSKADASKRAAHASAIAWMYRTDTHDNTPANPAAHAAWERAANDCDRISEALASRAMWLKSIETAARAMDGLAAPLHPGDEPREPALVPRTKIPEATHYLWAHVVPRIAANMDVDLAKLAMGDAAAQDRAALAYRHAALYARATPQERGESARVLAMVNGEWKRTNAPEAHARKRGGVQDAALTRALQRAKRLGVPLAELAKALGTTPEALKQARRRRRP